MNPSARHGPEHDHGPRPGRAFLRALVAVAVALAAAPVASADDSTEHGTGCSVTEQPGGWVLVYCEAEACLDRTGVRVIVATSAHYRPYVSMPPCPGS